MDAKSNYYEYVSTSSYQNVLGEGKALISMMDLEAVELRFLGYNNKEIGETLSRDGKRITHQRVKQWFARGGKLFDFYNEYAKEHISEARKYSQDVLTAHLTTAVRVLIDIVQDENASTSTRISAAKYILERGLGRTPLPVSLRPEEDPLDKYFARLDKKIEKELDEESEQQ